MNVSNKISAAVLFLGLVLAGYISVQYFNPVLFADRESRNEELWKLPPVDPALTAERSKPRFAGEIGGIFLAPEGTPIPDKYTTFDDLCTERKSWIVPDSEAGALTLDIELPEEYVLDTESVNTGTVACDGGVTGSRKTYLYHLPNGDTADVVIGRSFSEYDTIDVAIDRVSFKKVANRNVVIIDAVTENGYWDHAYAYFPEPFGKTYISASQLPRAEFMKLVELVASTTRTQ